MFAYRFCRKWAYNYITVTAKSVIFGFLIQCHKCTSGTKNVTIQYILIYFSSFTDGQECYNWTAVIQPKFKWYFWLYWLYTHTVVVYSWSIANNFVIGVYCKCLEILSQIAFSSVANYFRSYRKKVIWFRICRHLQFTPITQLLTIESLIRSLNSATQWLDIDMYEHSDLFAFVTSQDIWYVLCYKHFLWNVVKFKRNSAPSELI